ncbi:hypothetical protein SAMN05444166_8270 [Singulisphaera sp. GP187]|uniref:hypothetical protein n=1 Tax=Singulisphaera sp. GP187 TaxID=1882752 RepID=UPI00092B3E08|nr:hypothetical protein [Singulisphaera sp. GP187]SIO66913.1 hypothetical protein SAMN05444166_8270 [Singulisphaera sp. GP187]
MRRTFALFALAAAMGPLAAPTPAPAQSPPAPQPTVITLRPAAAPRPALKYRLVPERRTLVPGNAAIFYHRAIQMLLELRRNDTAQTKKEEPGSRPESIDERISRWGTVPLDEFPRDEARKELEPYQRVLNEIELGAIRTTCDWEFDLRKEGIELLLPEIQEMRALARLVKVRTRLEILDGKTDEAMRWIQIGLVMGRHVSQGPIVIQALVGVAIDTVMIDCLIDLIQAPGTPSLFWALADRPQPFIDMRPSLEGERYLLERELPELNDLDREGVWSLDEARRFTSELQRKLYSFATGETIPGINAALPNLSGSARRLGIAAMAAKIYPEARRTLIAEGRPEAEVEEMPIVQVASLFTLQEYRRHRDESYKWMNLPYWQSFSRAEQETVHTMENKLANPLLTMFQLLSPALNTARLAALRVDRKFDALECVEAIRLHVHAHPGKLPASLEDITDAPVPRDPATGLPFVYRVHGDTATLTAPVPPGAPNHPVYAIDYLLKLAH